MRYAVTAADRAAAPPTYFTEPRYLGYREADYEKPYARYFRPSSEPVQDHVKEALLAGPQASEYGPRLSELADILSRPGYLPMETGYTVSPEGKIVVSVLTRMPGVTGEMWDWWFGWHGTETARYKLWHPDAHFYSGVAEDRSAAEGLSDRQKYVGNVSFVDEYLGENASPLTVRFYDPTRLGFASSRAGGTVIAARGGLSTLPVSFAWLVHQVRETSDGCEMRSRFVVNDFECLDLPRQSLTSTAGKIMTIGPVRRMAGLTLPRIAAVKLHHFGPAMLYHCAQEMNHLATFLPSLYADFRGTP